MLIVSVAASQACFRHGIINLIVFIYNGKSRQVKIVSSDYSSAQMSIAELFPTLRNLSRAEKLQIMQFLVQELADEEALSLQPGATYHVWSPFNSHDAASKLAALLEEDRQASDG